MSSDTPKIKHRPIVPFDYGTLRDDAATFYVNNKVFEGFKSVSVTKSLMSMSGSFSLVAADVWQPNAQFEIKPDDRIHCHLGKEAIFEGYINKLTINITPSSRNFTYSGRDRTADLIDCVHTGAADFNDMTISEFATVMLKPFGLKVLNPYGVDVGKKFSTFTIKQGETVFEALNRAAKSVQLILLTSTHGNLILDKRANRRSGMELIEGINVKMTGADFDHSGRFSEYIVKGQGSSVIGSTDDSTKAAGRATDPEIPRHRPTVIISEQASDADAAQKRAEFEASYKVAKSFTCSAVVRDWTKKDGKLWAVNELVFLSAPSIGIKSDLLISEVTYNLNDSGRSCSLKLIRKDAFEFEKEVKKENSIIDSIGY